MARRPSVLVVQHEDRCPVAMIEPWLEREGVGCDVLRPDRGDRLPPRLDGHDGLLVLGGHMGANDDAAHGWLRPTKDLVATTASAGGPFLGVCLGHQLAAVALGGRVTRNPHGPTRALLPFGPTSEGVEDPFASALSPGDEVLHHNDDVVVELPDGAALLAVAPDGTVQAARFGERAWGVQFHPEVDAGVVRGWARGADLQAEAACAAALESRREELHVTWEALIRRFGRVVAAG